MNYWYAARPNEIFLDLDSTRALARAMNVLRRILNKPMPAPAWGNGLHIEAVYHYPTSKTHHHLIIVTGREHSYVMKTEWALWMGTDRIRAVYSLERGRRELPIQDLLVSKEPYYRTPDAFCECKGKHKPHKVTRACPALEHLLGSHKDADYFPRNTDRKKRPPLFVPVGRVSLSSIRKWKGEDQNGSEASERRKH